MEVSPVNQFALVVSKSPANSFQGLLDSQKELLRSQIDQLQNIVVNQCNLTGVNPLSQEMAAGALSIKIGKRPRDLLNPKAIKYMQSVFSIKDEISKKDSRAISALFGVTATQVRDFFNVQRSRVRRFIRLSKEQATKSNACIEAPDGPSCSDSSMPIQSVPLNSLGPTTIDGPSCSSQDEVLPGTDESDKYFMANIFNLMRKEESFAGQVTLLEWILQIQNSSVLYWFLTKGGVMILATWLSQAAIEEQTSFLHVSLRVLCHLPLHRALPAQMSAILQSVNKLRFYRKSDISNRAKNLLSRWSKIFARSQAARKPNASVSPADAQDEMLLKQSIGEIMGNELCELKTDILGGTQSLLTENFDNSRNLGSSQPMKLLTSAAEDSKKLLRGVSSSQTRERRKVQLVEQPGQRQPARSSQVSRSSTATQARPLSTDDIQKAKMRAQFMQSKYGKSAPSDGSSPVKGNGANTSSSTQASTMHPAPKPPVQPKVEEQKKPMKPLARTYGQQDSPNDKAGLESEEPLWKKCRRVHVPWVTPPEFTVKKEWHVCAGENSKEVGIQNSRMRREKGVTYNTPFEIPSNPKDPWDQEIDYDDTLTPEISTEALPENDAAAPAEPAEPPAPVLARENPEPAVKNAVTNDTSMNSAAATPDLELLGVLLRYPEVVIALTSGQAGNLSNEQMVQLLDTIKTKGVSAVGDVINGFVGRNAEEKVEVSLPSPTPSSNPVTSGWRPEMAKNPGQSGWRPEMAKNPFSRQRNVTVNGQGYAIPAISFQEKLPSTSTTRYMSAPLQQQSPSLPQQQFLHASVHDQSFAMASRNGQSWAPDMVASRKNISGSNVLNAPSAGFFPPAALPTQTRHQLQPQQPVIPEARVSATQMPVFPKPRAWTGRPDSASSNIHSPAYNHNHNYSGYDGGDFGQAPWQPGSSHSRNGYYGAEPGFESWSPDNSPVRAQTGGHYLNPGMNMGHSYRPDTSRYPRNQPGYRGNGRNDNPKFQNRRR